MHDSVYYPHKYPLCHNDIERQKINSLYRICMGVVQHLPPTNGRIRRCTHDYHDIYSVEDNNFIYFLIQEFSELDAFCYFERSLDGLIMVDCYRDISVRGRSLLAIIFHSICRKLNEPIYLSNKSSSTAKQLVTKLIAYNRIHTMPVVTAETYQSLTGDSLSSIKIPCVPSTHPLFLEEYSLKPMTYIRDMEYEEYD
jgi:hypothetical protein